MKEILSLACDAAVQAGKIIQEYRSKKAVRVKDKQELVTAADIESERLITGMIGEKFPDHGVYGEESQRDAIEQYDDVWVVDPLDGTNNYAHGIPHYAVSIAYAHKGTVRCGVVFDPNRDEMFTAIRGTGAWLNDQPIHTSGCRDIGEAVVTFGFYYDRDSRMVAALDAVGRVLSSGVQGVRRTGSAALDCSWLACGRFDGYFEYYLSPWDYAAGQLIAEEAGARASTCNGEELSLKPDSFCAATAEIYDALLGLVKKDRD